MSTEQVNWLPEGKTVSAGFNAWHVLRTQDNIVNFVFQKKPPVWMAAGFLERMALPKVEQGTGMGLEQARGIAIPDVGLLREYGAAVRGEVVGYLRGVDLAELEEVQLIKPLGEMPKWRVVRQVLMTHGFMHLGEINLIKGLLGMQFSI
ncbi:MAG: DinB family protein [Gemmataceae bacterium]|nr:DinB family protein [Gemmataceae bacterium]